MSHHDPSFWLGNDDDVAYGRGPDRFGAYFFGGPFHGIVRDIPTHPDDYNGHLLNAPSQIEVASMDREIFGVYLRTSELEAGALLYRWVGPEWDIEMQMGAY